MMIYIWNFSESLKKIIKRIYDKKTEIFTVDTSNKNENNFCIASCPGRGGGRWGGGGC